MRTVEIRLVQVVGRSSAEADLIVCGSGSSRRSSQLTTLFFAAGTARSTCRAA